ncbi:uncharacterized protein LACBIDRAFT_302695 [Laccaria bicolor S238N-H82]|uniref:Predicted protein n=1 Tax=Laccaria bicolor (strain S238N-H82 / ATCC MYA-4686) TaxID=486041 RepID=B0E437_LACBS|nr:uncharacterized protein LACBIDRAFT_302695 [Laccaria bicolor S238N-H82]EDQ98397.1 predicted protein [Laccaria bicolor S238N-H82]|eukprot:XP_001890955.1 predicted protein [Laccaria bicolor S238N-H82]
MVLERWPCNEPIPGAKGWSITDISSNGINLIFTYMISKDETKNLAPQIVLWSDDYTDLVVGSEEWLDIPIVTGESESGELVVLARVKNCAPEVENAARQNDGGADCPPLLRARVRSQIMEDNTLKVIKKKKTTTTSTQVGRQKRKLREEPKPSGAGVEAEKLTSSDGETQDDPRAPVISPIRSPPAKRVRRQELVGQGIVLGSQPVREIQGGPRDGGWESQDGPLPQSMSQGPDNERGLDQVHGSRGMSQQRNTHNEAGSDRAGGSRLRAWNDAEGCDHNNFDTDVNMYDEDDAFMDEYQTTRFEPSFSMQDHYHRPPPQFSNNQHYGHHPQQYATSDFGGRGRGLRSQFRGHARPYDSNGYYGRGNEGFTGHGPRRVGRGHSENGDEERFTDGGVLRRRHPSEGRGF